MLRDKSSLGDVAQVAFPCPITLHARPTALLVKVARQYDADITHACDNKKASAKTMLGVLALCGCEMADLRILAKGPDANEAVRALTDLFEQLAEEQRSASAIMGIDQLAARA